ncbi:MAG TPA: class I SAM-dependent methyltransferase [Phycisphaerae bacterium]|nr:class I SAM-dependent methyltransferase [Phycisphaerae bacterium]
MTDPASYDWHSAQEYLESLLPEEVRRLEPERPPAPAQPLQPTIGPSAAQLVDILILAHRPRRVLEIGTSVGYSAIAIGRALQRVGGRLVTVEIDPRLAEAAEQNIAEAGMTDSIEVIIDDANQVIDRLEGPFGLILQDGDKDDYLAMLPRLVDLLEPHGLLVTDDLLFPVMNLPDSAKRWQYAMGLYNEALQNRRDLQTVWLPIGDGVAVSVKVEAPGD